MICSRCGNDKQIEIHHIIHRARGGKNNPDNLKPLCRGCHDYQHSLEDIMEHIADNKRKNQVARLKIWEYRLEVLETLNTPELIRERGFTSYWIDIKTHYMGREVKNYNPPQIQYGLKFEDKKES
jgi:hypothetical protein